MASRVQSRQIEEGSKVGILFFDDGLGEKSTPTGPIRFLENDWSDGWQVMDGLSFLGTAFSAILGGRPRLDGLFRDDGSINSQGGRQELEHDEESGAGDASYEGSYSEKDVQCLQQLAWRMDRRTETN